jgi:hypothetical protein
MDAPAHEHAWAAALAEEHAHQRELLATLRGELGTFARECAAALTAIETLAGLAGVAEIVAGAAADVKHASLVLEVGRRLGLPGHDAKLEDLYRKLGGNEDVPPDVVRHASALLETKESRSDRQLLTAVVSASGAAAAVEELVGPAPWAALAALQPLARWAPQLAKIRRGEADLSSAAGDLSQVLQAAAQIGAGAEAALAGEAAALAGSAHDAVNHVESAVAAVKDGKLAQVLAEMRRTLQADLDKLRAIHEGAAGAPEQWRAERRTEHAELEEEVRTKLDRIERIRGVLGRILPHLQAVARTLSVVERLDSLAQRLEPQAAAGVEASSLTLVTTLGAVWDAAFGPGPQPPATAPKRRPRARHLVAAAVVVAAAIVGISLAFSGGKTTPAAATTTTPTTTPAGPSKPRLTPIAAVFNPSARETVYTESAGGLGLHYTWSVSIPGDPGCAAGFKPNAPKPNQATWVHADVSEGGPCNHAHYNAAGFGHPGWVTVVVANGAWSCRDRFHGTQGRQAQPAASGSTPSRCQSVSG